MRRLDEAVLGHPPPHQLECVRASVEIMRRKLNRIKIRAELGEALTQTEAIELLLIPKLIEKGESILARGTA